MAKIKLEMEAADISQMLQILAQRPYIEVARLISQIEQQANRQVLPKKRKENAAPNPG